MKFADNLKSNEGLKQKSSKVDCTVLVLADNIHVFNYPDHSAQSPVWIIKLQLYMNYASKQELLTDDEVLMLACAESTPS